MDVISKQEAKKKGLNKFFTGEPCVNGHLDYRFVSRGEVCVMDWSISSQVPKSS